MFFIVSTSFSESNNNTVGSTNFAFASYLGTGFYSTSGQDVFVIQLPFDYIITQKTNTEAGLIVNLPLTIGIINFSNINSDELPDIKDITTLTFLPGLEYQYPITPNWTISPFVDYGFARDFNNATNISVFGMGIKSFYNIPVGDAMVSLGNRFLYARESNKNTNINSDYSLIETGLNYRVTSDYSHEGGAIFSNLYYINFYYPKNLVFLEQTNKPIRVDSENEIGITFSNLPDFWFFEKPQIGLGVRFSNDVNVYRLVFGAPF